VTRVCYKFRNVLSMFYCLESSGEWFHGWRDKSMGSEEAKDVP